MCREGLYAPAWAPVKRMTRLSIALVATVAAVISFARPAAADPPQPQTIALNRCNAQTVNDAGAHLHEYERRAARDGSAGLLQRYGALADIVSALSEEHEILDSICTDQAQRNALFAQVGAYSAWALALESDVAAKLNASCPAATKALPTMMLADAWLALANVVNDQGGAVPRPVSEVAPKIRTRADAISMALPEWPNTSNYWRDQVTANAKAAIAACPSPAPSPATSP